MVSPRSARRAILLVFALASALLCPACGTPLGLPIDVSPPTRSVIVEEEWALDALQAVATDVRLTGFGTGNLDATVEWTFASDDVDLYVTATTCTAEMFENERCAYKARADSPRAKPERVSFDISGGDSYRFWIVNFGPERESGTFVVGLTQ
jgi:hypothetical protein